MISSSSSWVPMPAPRLARSSPTRSKTSTSHPIDRNRFAASNPPSDPPITIARRMPCTPLGPSVAVLCLHAHVLHHVPLPAPPTGAHDVEVAARIAPDPVAGLEGGITPAREALARERQHAHHAAVVLDDVHDVLGVDVEDRGSDEL